jgi:predicted NBD/HSP70 family sugar kinase
MSVEARNGASSHEERKERNGHALSGTNLERAGDHNQRVTLHAIRLYGPITRADLVSLTGLTAPAIGNITKRLLQENLIKEAGRWRGARGQPALKLVINSDGCFSVGVNIDRDHITFVVLDFQGRVRARMSREMRFALPATVESLFRHTVGELLSKAGVTVTQLVGIGVAFPDDIQRAELPNQPPAYSAWGAVAIDRLLSRTLPVPIFVENDAAAAAMGEMQFGRGQHHQSFFYILITAALGGGLVVNGQYFRGANGRSGELGLLFAHETSGEPRLLQNIVSLSALYSRLATKGYRVSCPRQLIKLDEHGQKIVDAWVETSVEALVQPMLAINCLINPEAVLIGGRLPATIVDTLAARITQRLQAYATTTPAIAPVNRAALSEDAPAVGAAILPFSHRLLPSRAALMKTAVG